MCSLAKLILANLVSFTRVHKKNLGPAGITLVIIRDDLIGHARQATPSIWNYATQCDADSMINTPPTFAWYLCSLVFKHIQAIGGLKENCKT